MRFVAVGIVECGFSKPEMLLKISCDLNGWRRILEAQLSDFIIPSHCSGDICSMSAKIHIIIVSVLIIDISVLISLDGRVWILLREKLYGTRFVIGDDIEANNSANGQSLITAIRQFRRPLRSFYPPLIHNSSHKQYAYVRSCVEQLSLSHVLL